MNAFSLNVSHSLQTPIAAASSLIIAVASGWIAAGFSQSAVAAAAAAAPHMHHRLSGFPFFVESVAPSRDVFALGLPGINRRVSSIISELPSFPLIKQFQTRGAPIPLPPTAPPPLPPLITPDTEVNKTDSELFP